MQSDRLSRKAPLAISYLFVPGNRPERFSKACEAGPDVIILDLEDAVHPDSKAAARTAIRGWQEGTPSVACERYIRLNSVRSALFVEDLSWLSDLRYPERCDGIFLPKAECSEALARVVERLLEWRPALAIVAIIETAKGLQQIESIAAIPGLARLAFGSLDFSLDINCSQVPEAFLPDSRQLAWADRVMRAVATGSHAVQVDGEMVDLPLIEHARRLPEVGGKQAHVVRADAC